MITTPDDGMLRTHDEALQLLRYAVPGARVALHPVALPGSTKANAAARRYTVTVPRVGAEPLETADIYTLPTPAAPIARRVRDLADYALRA